MAQTFRPRQRIRQRPEFLRVYERGRKVHGRFMTLFVLPNDLDVSRLGVAATRKLGTAVKRNFAKRRLREVFRHLEPGATCDCVVVPKQAFFDAGYAEIDAEFRSLLRRPSGRLRR